MIYQQLSICPGITAVIGSGGKTSLLRVLAAQLPGSVLLATTTHFLPFPEFPLLEDPKEDQLAAALQASRVVCLGKSTPEGKLTAPTLPMERLAALADYVLVEADGSRHLPIKAHSPQEPVIPPGTDQIIQVVGASGFGQPVTQAVHRPEIYRQIVGNDPMVTPSGAANLLRAENLCHRIFLNQTDCISPELAAEFCRKAHRPVLCASLLQYLPAP